MLLAGDYNIAHKEIDIHDPKGNKNSSGFLPEERAWMDSFFSKGWIDTFRKFVVENSGLECTVLDCFGKDGVSIECIGLQCDGTEIKA